MYYLNRRYKFTKYLSVLMVTVGIIICTLESGKVIHCCDSPVVDKEESTNHSFHWLLGVAMMTCSLFLGARMGIFQEQIYHSYGKFPKEALYYTVSLKKIQFPNYDYKRFLFFFNHSTYCHCLDFCYSAKTFTAISCWPLTRSHYNLQSLP